MDGFRERLRTLFRVLWRVRWAFISPSKSTRHRPSEAATSTAESLYSHTGHSLLPWATNGPNSPTSPYKIPHTLVMYVFAPLSLVPEKRALHMSVTTFPLPGPTGMVTVDTYFQELIQGRGVCACSWFTYSCDSDAPVSLSHRYLLPSHHRSSRRCTPGAHKSPSLANTSPTLRPAPVF